MIELIPATPELLRAIIANSLAALAPLCNNGAEICEAARLAAEQSLAHYDRVGATAPWAGYFARDDDAIVGICAFAAPPKDGEVEVAYGTFAPLEGYGVATAMAERLIAIASSEPTIRFVTANTAPEENASTHILRKLGFARDGSITDADIGEAWHWRRVTHAHEG